MAPPSALTSVFAMAIARARATATATVTIALAVAGCGGDFGAPPSDTVDAGDRVDEDGPTGFIDYTPSNIDVDHLTIGTADMVISGDVVINTTTGDISGPGLPSMPGGSIFIVAPQTDATAPMLGIYSWASLTIETGSTITVEGDNGLVFAVAGNVTIDGTIDASATALLAGPGGFAGGNDLAVDGAGPGGGTSQGNRDAGGGGGGHGASGGNGGRQEGNDGGLAGLASGSAANVPLLGGSGGARGGAGTGGGIGGAGGGAVQISARGEIRLGAASGINVSGAGGIGGSNDRGGGGGGSGGAILLEGKFVVVEGIFATNGGGGGAGANQNTKGNDGTPGAFSDAPAAGGVGAGEGTTGGAGAAADLMTGQIGLPGIGNTGGGGGGAGRIYVRSRETASVGALVSPTGSIAVGTL